MTSIVVNEEDGELESRMALTAAVMADKSRSRMLCALMDYRAWTATELSAVADISPSTASAHRPSVRAAVRGFSRPWAAPLFSPCKRRHCGTAGASDGRRTDINGIAENHYAFEFASCADLL